MDFVSILNQYCQKSRINVPKYSEVPGVLGGYGSQVFVKGQIFTNMKYCATKKEARHDAAKVALLGLNIPVGKCDQYITCSYEIPRIKLNFQNFTYR